MTRDLIIIFFKKILSYLIWLGIPHHHHFTSDFLILHSSNDSIKLKPQWEKKDFDLLKQTIWFEGVRNAWVIQAVNCKEVMKALPKILRYFTSKVWGFPFKIGIQSKPGYKTLKKERSLAPQSYWCDHWRICKHCQVIGFFKWWIRWPIKNQEFPRYLELIHPDERRLSKKSKELSRSKMSLLSSSNSG